MGRFKGVEYAESLSKVDRRLCFDMLDQISHSEAFDAPAGFTSRQAMRDSAPVLPASREMPHFSVTSFKSFVADCTCLCISKVVITALIN